jgi:pimeloyl-ACP methyl ester carboxylesterase
VIDRGCGTTFVVIPGIQGRWEWVAPTVDALATRGRVLAFSLCDEPSSGFSCRLDKRFDNYVEQVDAVLARAGVERAVVVGISFGGLIAAEFAARYPDRVMGLVLASALPVDWEPDRRARFYLRAPRLLSPIFWLDSPRRVYPEVAAAFPRLKDRLRFSTHQGLRVFRAFLSPTRMARRIHWATAHRFADPSRVAAPALIVTGEPDLDRVVPTHITARCARGLRNVSETVLPRTGHLGMVTRADLFATVVARFAENLHHERHADTRRAGAERR